jgi:hypothetical protein
VDGQQSWESFLDEVVDALEPYVAQMYRYPESAVISTRTVASCDQSGLSIRLNDLGDGTVLVRAGWTIEVAANYDIEEPGIPSQATQLVIGICSGQAEEAALIDDDGNWVGVNLGIRYQRGELLRVPHKGAEAVRRIPAWPLKSEWTAPIGGPTGDKEPTDPDSGHDDASFGWGGWQGDGTAEPGRGK